MLRQYESRFPYCSDLFRAPFPLPRTSEADSETLRAVGLERTESVSRPLRNWSRQGPTRHPTATPNRPPRDLRLKDVGHSARETKRTPLLLQGAGVGIPRTLRSSQGRRPLHARNRSPPDLIRLLKGVCTSPPARITVVVIPAKTSCANRLFRTRLYSTGPQSRDAATRRRRTGREGRRESGTKLPHLHERRRRRAQGVEMSCMHGAIPRGMRSEHGSDIVEKGAMKKSVPHW